MNGTFFRSIGPYKSAALYGLFWFFAIAPMVVLDFTIWQALLAIAASIVLPGAGAFITLFIWIAGIPNAIATLHFRKQNKGDMSLVLFATPKSDPGYLPNTLCQRKGK